MEDGAVELVEHILHARDLPPHDGQDEDVVLIHALTDHLAHSRKH